MAHTRRHWLLSVVYVLALVGGLAITLTPTLFPGKIIQQAVAQAEDVSATGSQTIDPNVYTRVQQIRQELSLANRDLAAMGCDEETATQILQSLKSWCTTNQAVLDRHHQDTIQAKAKLRDAVRRINEGTDDPRVSRSLPELRADLVHLAEQRQIMMDGLIANLESQLSSTQRLVWQTARENNGLPASLRYVPGLSSEPIVSVSINTIRVLPESTTLVRNISVDDLTWSQKQAAEAARINMIAKATEIHNAEKAVLPMPKLLNFDQSAEQVISLHDD